MTSVTKDSLEAVASVEGVAEGDPKSEISPTGKEVGDAAAVSTALVAAAEGVVTLKAPKPSDEFLFKICLLGDAGTGKTAFARRLVHRIFSPAYKSTIGVDFAIKVLEGLEVDGTPCTVRLQLWDIAGQERFGNMTRVYYKQSDAALVFCDTTRISTCDAAMKWIDDFRRKTDSDSSPLPVMVIGTKVDLSGAIAAPDLQKMAEGWGISFFAPMDCKTQQPQECFGVLENLARELVRKRRLIPLPQVTISPTAIVSPDASTDTPAKSLPKTAAAAPPSVLPVVERRREFHFWEAILEENLAREMNRFVGAKGNALAVVANQFTLEFGCAMPFANEATPEELDALEVRGVALLCAQLPAPDVKGTSCTITCLRKKCGDDAAAVKAPKPSSNRVWIHFAVHGRGIVETIQTDMEEKLRRDRFTRLFA